MKIRFYSDLHVEWGKFKNWPKDDCKGIVLILAGDIGVGLSARSMIETMCKYYKAVIMVTGNHEYYRQHMNVVDRRFTEMSSKIDNFYFLQNTSVVIDTVRFFGGTMWTSLNNGNWFVCQNAKNKMNDFNLIRYYNEDKISVIFDTNNVQELFGKFKISLEQTLAQPHNGKTVVISHHAPCELSVHTQYKGNSLNYAYYEDMTQYMFGDNAPELFIHGHMHNTSDYVVGNTRILANPRGYAGHSLNTSFNMDILIDI